MSDAEISREQLHAYLDDALSESETAQIEKSLRDSSELQKRLRAVIEERDRGEHSIGAIWRREQLTCPSREVLRQYILGVLDEVDQDYYRFHLEVIECPICVANFVDLKAASLTEVDKERRDRIFRSSAGLLQPKEPPADPQ